MTAKQKRKSGVKPLKVWVKNADLEICDLYKTWRVTFDAYRSKAFGNRKEHSCHMLVPLKEYNAMKHEITHLKAACKIWEHLASTPARKTKKGKRE